VQITKEAADSTMSILGLTAICLKRTLLRKKQDSNNATITKSISNIIAVIGIIVPVSLNMLKLRKAVKARMLTMRKLRLASKSLR
jgi:hypothetical protein